MNDGAMMLMCDCFTCGRVFCCDPELVPSLPANVTGTGTKEPVCKVCVDRANPDRIKNGLEPIVPLPGAYFEEEDHADVQEA